MSVVLVVLVVSPSPSRLRFRVSLSLSGSSLDGSVFVTLFTLGSDQTRRGKRLEPYDWERGLEAVCLEWCVCYLLEEVI